MDRFHSVMRVLIYWIGALVVSFVLAHDANAAAPVTYKKWTHTATEFVPAPVGYPYDTPQDACNVAFAAPYVFSRIKQITINEFECYWKKNGNEYVASITAKTTTECSGGGSPNTNLPIGEQCPDPPPTCQAGRKGSGDFFEGSSASPTAEVPDSGVSGFPDSDGQCDIVVDNMTKCYKTPNATGGRDFYCSYEWTQNGTQSPAGKPKPKLPPTTPKTPSESGPKKDPTPQTPCPKGTSNIGTDSSGTPICRGEGSNPGSPPTPPKTEQTTNTTNADGSTTKTTTTTQTNGDGSTTTKTVKETTGADGKKTTEVTESTSPRPDGKDGKKDESPDDKKDDLCKTNPQLNICKNSSVSGDCESVSCEGDAIQCAIYRQQQKEYCEAKKESAMRTLGDQLIAGNDPMKADLPTPKNGASFALGSFDSNGFLGGGACLPNVQLSNGVSLPVSQICEHILPLRFAIMTIAGLVAFGMLRSHVFKG